MGKGFPHIEPSAEYLFGGYRIEQGEIHHKGAEPPVGSGATGTWFKSPIFFIAVCVEDRTYDRKGTVKNFIYKNKESFLRKRH